MISHADLDAFSRACLRLYEEGEGAGDFARRATAAVREVVVADMCCVGELDTRDGALGVSFSQTDAGLPALLEGFRRTMGKYALFNWDEAVNGGRPFFRGDFFTRRQFRDLDVFVESFSRLGWMDHAAVHVPADDGKVVFLGLERSGARDFSERDRCLLTMLQPHLANARKRLRARGEVRGRERVEPAVFELAGFRSREAEVLMWLIEGKSNVEMARLMHIGVPTVKFHLTAIFNRMGLGNRLAVTLHALELARRASSRSAWRVVRLPRKS